MYFIDTNIFLDYLLDRRYGQDCEKLFKKLESGEFSAITSGFCIHTIEITLINLNKKTELQNFLRYLVFLEKLYIYHTALTDELQVIGKLEKTKLDFEDGLQYFVAKQFKCKAIISFDKHFDGLEIPRKEPKDIIN